MARSRMIQDDTEPVLPGSQISRFRLGGASDPSLTIQTPAQSSAMLENYIFNSDNKTITSGKTVLLIAAGYG
jgi:hypothetical protein